MFLDQDEDFVLHTFGMQVDLGLRDADVSALAALSLAEEALEALQQQAKGKSSAGVAMGQAIVQEHVAGFLARVRFRRALLKVKYDAFQCRSCLQRFPCKGPHVMYLQSWH